MHAVLLARSAGLNVLDAQQVRELFRESPLACLLLVLLPAVASSAGYYKHCAALEARYDARPRSEAKLWKIQDTRFLSPELHREEVLLGCFNAFSGAVLANCMTLAYLLYDYTALYIATEDFGLMWFAASFVALFFWIEAWAYCSHRFWHLQFVYARFHKIHHR
jgi:sterol desaturase/sphingolipid hydroxylase (fatty acid hydroxylase superfamily)